jgi:hypothetical protein
MSKLTRLIDVPSAICRSMAGPLVSSRRLPRARSRRLIARRAQPIGAGKSNAEPQQARSPGLASRALAGPSSEPTLTVLDGFPFLLVVIHQLALGETYWRSFLRSAALAGEASSTARPAAATTVMIECDVI